jgi:hypothetical protein
MECIHSVISAGYMIHEANSSGSLVVLKMRQFKWTADHKTVSSLQQQQQQPSFYSQVSWGRLEMKPHKQKKKYKTRAKKKDKTKGDKKTKSKNEKRQ